MLACWRLQSREAILTPLLIADPWWVKNRPVGWYCSLMLGSWSARSGMAGGPSPATIANANVVDALELQVDFKLIAGTQGSNLAPMAIEEVVGIQGFGTPCPMRPEWLAPRGRRNWLPCVCAGPGDHTKAAATATFQRPQQVRSGLRNCWRGGRGRPPSASSSLAAAVPKFLE